MREFNTKVAEGNYSITFETDDEKAYEQVQSLCRLLVDGKNGDAIPIGWLEKRASMCIGDFYKALTYAIEDWKYEQEHMVNGRWVFPKE